MLVVSTQLTVLLYNSADTRTVRKTDDVAINLTSLGPTLLGWLSLG
jgi:hypothetical protein